MSTLNTQQADPNSLLPRKYQEEVFVRAQKGNIIAALNTGSGKTLISLLLIKWIMAQESSAGKVVIFLVPKVTLVEQQATFIAQNTPLRVIKLHGALEVDLSDRTGWKRRFENHDVFVMTAQMLLNTLTHSLWSMDRVSLMVFDECHHARKNHPYNGILREYFHLNPPSRRPKIFGMTASPIWNPKDALGSLATLEANMDSKVIGVREHVDELTKHSPKPIEIIQEYPFPPEEYDYPSPTILQCLSVFDRATWDDFDIPWYNIEMRYFATLSNLGPYCASLFLYTEMQHHVSRLVQEQKRTLCHNSHDVEDGMIIDGSSSPKTKELSPDLFAIEEVLMGYESFFPSASFDMTLPVPLEWCTPKLRILTETLFAYKSSNFQAIIFVEQRQFAACLANVLPRIPVLKDIVRCAHLVGQGVNSEGVSNSIGTFHRDAVKLFKEGTINVLIATSVAEEGLDFPACDLVVRFDPLQHMVGYVQSRGRARNKASTFVIMIQKDDVAQLARYKALQEGEPEVNKAYQTRQHDAESMDVDEEDTHPADLQERERYVVPSTGAVLTYDNSINLLNYLCALIPRDDFTPIPMPRYTGDFQATLQLPRGLPLLQQHLKYTGPMRRSKKEAKRAVAYQAVKRLRELDVFDEYLLPAVSTKGKHTEDAEGKSIASAQGIPHIMTVSVRDPWAIGPVLWIHSVFIDNRRVAGLVTGTSLPPSEVIFQRSEVRIEAGERLYFDEDDEYEERSIMQQYTKLGIWYRNTASPLTSQLSLYLVPIFNDNRPDFDMMRSFLAEPYGSRDWSSIGEGDCGRLLIMNDNEFGRVRLLQRIRQDLSPASAPPSGSAGEGFSTYYEYFVHKWTRKRWVARVPQDGPLLESAILTRSDSGTYPLNAKEKPTRKNTAPALKHSIVPQGTCRWIDFPRYLYQAFEALPALCHRITDVYRIQHAKIALGLPPIPLNLLIEALTLPCANAKYSNQRMETLGDAVLQLCTTVHLMNKYPNRHEGQLSILRSQSVSNKYLLSRAKDVDLEQYLNSETQSVYKWRYVLPDGPSDELQGVRLVTREFPRRSLQDCMEAVLGASFITGGIEMSLQTGTALGLSFGGPHPWPLRYPKPLQASLVSSLFANLQDNLGYTFHENRLLLEAITHPSFACDINGPSYQRLEFLGDALLDLVVIKYLYNKFPYATSHELAWPRTRAICAPALACLAVKKLGLHKIMLVNSAELSDAISRYAPLLEVASGEEIVKRGWRYDPPKAISDIFESIMGAVLVDSGYNYEVAAAVVEFVMEDVLAVLSPSLAKDPVSELMEWTAGAGCRNVSFKKMQKLSGKVARDGIALLVHGIVVVGPLVSMSLTVAKFAAADRALSILQDASSQRSLAQLCNCKTITTDVVPLVSSLVLEEAPVEEFPSDNNIDIEEMEEVDMLLTAGSYGLAHSVQVMTDHDSLMC
ncbi:hypothetical protein BDQ12DRAFT_688964 [Crucibulum laeve]|uniref:P-loop containing nucleoside triphosphate hydrolase protein n=1 Tax=Crucibulum laeve TaxID=68775 RepID=A0A5C3LPP6_9AGAR|nr:hypothetical protein BDQ12DRAFT_688964 [Crucibulum laeve]